MLFYSEPVSEDRDRNDPRAGERAERGLCERGPRADCADLKLADFAPSREADFFSWW